MLEYRAKAETGEIVIGQELWQELDNLAEDFYNDRYFYNTDDAMLRMNFMENCVRLTKSPFYNKPMILMLWQKAWIETFYSFKMSETTFDRFKKTILLIARKNTKALDLNTRIPTPYGDRTIRDIEPGDMVFNELGEPVKVTAVSEVFKNRECYSVEFEDGEKIIADAEHLWTVQTKGSRKLLVYKPVSSRRCRAKEKTDKYGCYNITTKEMLKDFVRVRADGKGKEYKYRVPITAPLQYEKKDLFSPYVLGLWIGDGDKHDNRITAGKTDIPILVKELEKEGIEVTSINEYDGHFEIRIGHTESHSNVVRDALRKLGVWKNKHIPEQYFSASVEQRLDLLRGLMDTDGTCSKAGQCAFVQKSKRVTDDVSKLLSSLGIKHTVKEIAVKCNGKSCGIAYRIVFFVDKEHSCFRYERKTAKLKDHLAHRIEYKSIVNIERVKNRDTKCIVVDSPRHLFLCGERNTVTHNSETSSGLALSEFIVGNNGADICCSSNDDTQSSLVYDAIDTMRMLIDPDDLDTKRNQRFILNKNTNTKIFKMSDRTKNKEGRNIDFAIVDETHEMKENIIGKSIEQSQSLKDNPKFINITTEGFVIDGYLDNELEKARAVINKEDDGLAAERLLPWLYTQDSELEVWQGNRKNRLWEKSNPTLGMVKKWEYLEEQVDTARKSKADRIFVLSKDFNIKQNGAEAWLNLEDYDYSSTYNLEEFRGCFALGAVDLAFTTDLVAAKILVMKPDNNTKYVYSHYWIPENKLTESDDKNAGAEYEKWARKNLLTICEGGEVALSLVADWFYSLYENYDIKLWKCGYDQKFSKDWISRMNLYNWTKEDEDLVLIMQNRQTLSNAVKLCESDLKHQIVNYNEHEIDKWCLKNSGIEVDNLGQCMLVKMETQKRIDGAVALVILYEMYRRYRSEYKTMIERG